MPMPLNVPPTQGSTGCDSQRSDTAAEVMLSAADVMRSPVPLHKQVARTVMTVPADMRKAGWNEAMPPTNALAARDDGTMEGLTGESGA